MVNHQTALKVLVAWNQCLEQKRLSADDTQPMMALHYEGSLPPVTVRIRRAAHRWSVVR